MKRWCYLILLLLSMTGVVPAHAGRKLVAAVVTSDISRYKDAHRSLVKTLSQKGYDQNKVEIIVQTPNSDPISWANTIRKFNGIGSDVIVTYGAPVTLSAIREVDNIPVVFVDVYGPVESGIIRSMTAPGRLITGISSKVPMITLVKAANEIKKIKKIAVLYNPREIGSVVQLKEIRRLAAQMGFSVIDYNIASPTTLDSAFSSLTSSGADFLYAAESTLVTRSLEKIINRARDNNIPVISHIPDAAEKGALVSLEIDCHEQGQMAGEYVSAILQGKKQAQMQVLTPKKVDLVVNLKVARQFDLDVPIQVLNISTKIVK